MGSMTGIEAMMYLPHAAFGLFSAELADSADGPRRQVEDSGGAPRVQVAGRLVGEPQMRAVDAGG
jgi:hypothetical protein